MNTEDKLWAILFITAILIPIFCAFYKMGRVMEKTEFQNKAIEAGVGKLVLTNSTSRIAEFVFITNNVTELR
jgi:hypothetical protein